MPPLAATNADLLAKIKALEAWKLLAVTQLTTLASRVTLLETAPPGTDYSAAIAALQADVAALKLLTCPEAVRLDRIDADLARLVADHLPEV